MCTVCAYELVPKLEHDHQYDLISHVHACVCGETQEFPEGEECPDCGGEFPWWILCTAEAVVIVGLAVLLVLRKRK